MKTCVFLLDPYQNQWRDIKTAPNIATRLCELQVSSTFCWPPAGRKKYPLIKKHIYIFQNQICMFRYICVLFGPSVSGYDGGGVGSLAFVHHPNTKLKKLSVRTQIPQFGQPAMLSDGVTNMRLDERLVCDDLGWEHTSENRKNLIIGCIIFLLLQWCLKLLCKHVHSAATRQWSNK